MANYEGYCVKCREKREFDGQEVELANGRRAAQGLCPTCGTKMNRILGKKKDCPAAAPLGQVSRTGAWRAPAGAA